MGFGLPLRPSRPWGHQRLTLAVGLATLTYYGPEGTA
jgi:hypothetical protein